MPTQPADAPTAPPQAQPPAGSTPQPLTDEVLYYGIAKHSANIGVYLMWVGLCILGGLIGYGLLQIPALSGYPLWVLSLIGVPMLLWSYLVHIKHRYKVTRRRVETERGVLTLSLIHI